LRNNVCLSLLSFANPPSAAVFGVRQFLSITLTVYAIMKANTIASGQSRYGMRGESVIVNLTH
jgi:hypothetical protein